MAKDMKKYSVLLLYPDYIASNFGQETYLAHVLAKSPKDAKIIAQAEAASEQEGIENDEDFFVLLVTEGHIEDLS